MKILVLYIFIDLITLSTQKLKKVPKDVRSHIFLILPRSHIITIYALNVGQWSLYASYTDYAGRATRLPTLYRLETDNAAK